LQSDCFFTVLNDTICRLDDEPFVLNLFIVLYYIVVHVYISIYIAPWTALHQSEALLVRETQRK